MYDRPNRKRLGKETMTFSACMIKQIVNPPRRGRRRRSGEEGSSQTGASQIMDLLKSSTTKLLRSTRSILRLTTNNIGSIRSDTTRRRHVTCELWCGVEVSLLFFF